MLFAFGGFFYWTRFVINRKAEGTSPAWASVNLICVCECECVRIELQDLESGHMMWAVR